MSSPRLSAALVALGPLLASIACSDSHVARAVFSTLGEACNERQPCLTPLVCTEAGVCAPSGTVGEGERCVVSVDCAAALQCVDARCAPAGAGILGDVCTKSGECSRGLRCAFVGFGSTCQAGGDGYLAERCDSSEQCMAGLVCDPTADRCVAELGAPSGMTCTSTAQCAVDGYVCAADGTGAKRCTGLGPDGIPVPVWQGLTCPPSRSLDAPFRLHFDVDPVADGDFFRLPFPNDARIVDGHVVLDGFPVPPAPTTPVDLVGRYVEAIEADQPGFGGNQTVFMRFSGTPVICGAGCGESGAPASESGCIGATEPEQTVYVVDLSRDTGAFRANPFTPVGYRWVLATESRPYICGPWLAVAPVRETPWVAGHTYAVFVHARVKGCDGEQRVAVAQDADFAAMLVPSTPGDAALAHAHAAYEPLRSWLASSPVFPTGEPVTAATLAGATVFTVRDATTTMQAVANAVAAETAPVVTGVQVCSTTAPTGDCLPAASGAFTELQGVIELPIFQSGDAPYAETGGEIALPSTGPATVVRRELVRFALSIPSGTMPTAGWPVVVYAHGTGGSFRSHVLDGAAAALAQATTSTAAGPVGFAVLGIDQVQHGTRRGSSSASPDGLVFNVVNPRAARGNFVQGAADQLVLIRSVTAVAAAVAAQPSQSAVKLDATKVSYFGHSQGGTVGVLAMAFAPSISTVVLSGTGAGLLEAFRFKTSPFPMLGALRMALADPALTDPVLHPVTSLMQGFLEEADPTAYARLLVREPPAGVAAKSVLHLVGVGDTFTPNEAGLALARRMGSPVYDPTSSGLAAGEPVATLPARKNVVARTLVTSIFAPPADADGHFVAFDVDEASAQCTAFFASGALDAEALPTVEP